MASDMVAVHTLKLRPGIKAEDFKRVMPSDVFVAVAGGRIDRGGRSNIESQHLLLRDGAETEYLWFIKKKQSVFDASAFREVAQQMLENVRKQLETYATITGSATYIVIDSLDIGRRDQTGEPIGVPTRGSSI